MGFRIKLMSIPTPRGGEFDHDMCTETITEVCKLRLVLGWSESLCRMSALVSDVHGKRENGFSTPGGESSTREFFWRNERVTFGHKK